MTLRLLVVASETADQQDARRRRSGQASHESYADALRQMVPGCDVARHCCVDGSSGPDLARHDAVLFAGSPIQMHEGGAEARAAAGFAERIFASGVPSFGSCAGLQIAAGAAAGSSAPRGTGLEAGFARAIVVTEAGRLHPMLAGRPLAWDAPAMHSSVVDRLPPGAMVLARAEGTPVEAVEIRSGQGTFWGVQYHPELALREIADALRAQADDIVGEGLARDDAAVARYADALDALDAEPDRRDLLWQLGIDGEVTEPGRRRREIANFLRHVAAR